MGRFGQTRHSIRKQELSAEKRPGICATRDRRGRDAYRALMNRHTPSPHRTRCRRGPVSLLLMLSLSACGGDDSETVTGSDEPVDAPVPRTFLMGWSPIVPRAETRLLLEVIDSIAAVSEIMLLQQAVPWEALLAGASMDSLVQDVAQLTDFIEAKGMQIMFLVDPLDGFDRRLEHPALVEAGRSVVEPEIRAMHEEWVLRIAARVRPLWFGLASEINSLAASGDPGLYAEILDLINTLAPKVRQISPASRVFVSFQADQANGVLGATGGIDHFALIDDFDIDGLGLSSYPVFAFDDPSEVPANYFTAFDEATDLPLLMVEGGWSSEDVPWSTGTPEQQRQFFVVYERLLDGVDAEAWVMLTFTDIDFEALGLSPERALGRSNFGFMGIVDTELQRKPAYDEWLRIFSRPLQ